MAILFAARGVRAKGGFYSTNARYSGKQVPVGLQSKVAQTCFVGLRFEGKSPLRAAVLD